MSKPFVHVNQQLIAFNRKHGTDFPVFTVKSGDTTRYARRVFFQGPSTLVYEPHNPKSCGARAWIETDPGSMILEGEMNFSQVKRLMEEFGVAQKDMPEEFAAACPR